MTKKQLAHYDSRTYTGLSETIVKPNNMRRYSFRLAIVPPDQAVKLIELNSDSSVSQIKRIVQRHFRILNPIFDIKFIFNCRVLLDGMKFSKIGINRKYTILVMPAQGISRFVY